MQNSSPQYYLLAVTVKRGKSGKKKKGKDIQYHTIHKEKHGIRDCKKWIKQLDM